MAHGGAAMNRVAGEILEGFLISGWAGVADETESDGAVTRRVFGRGIGSVTCPRAEKHDTGSESKVMILWCG